MLKLIQKKMLRFFQHENIGFLKQPLILFVLLFSLQLQAQTKTNLEVFKALVDSSISNILNKVGDPEKKISLNLKLGESYQVFEDQVFKSAKASGKSVSVEKNDDSKSEISYTLENAKVSYGECFRDGFLGAHYVPRVNSLSGSYRIFEKEVIVDDFSLQVVDTVRYDEIESLENSSYPFTNGEIPSEPFFSSLFEPLVAVTTAAIVITLFFTVRSK
ncbi:MAG: hypothetical protein HXY50_10475 [Ignavibacteriaceae bacterium]|nr:hypothetical protein [Ignavibacteriaceae bacterium]